MDVEPQQPAELSVDSRAGVVRVGIVLVGMDAVNLPALKYLLLQLNTLQTSVQFELCPSYSDEAFFEQLGKRLVVDREKLRDQCAEFGQRYRARLDAERQEYEVREDPPAQFVIVSLAKFADEYYTMRRSPVAVIALGNWERYMAPPTLVEFLLTLVMREAIAKVSRSTSYSMHCGTKGCICDFTDDLQETRYKVLSAFVCDFCRQMMVRDGVPKLADEAVHVLRRDWIGSTSDPRSPASIVAKLGLDLFATKGLRTTGWERFSNAAHDETVKWMVKGTAILLAAALLVLVAKLAPDIAALFTDAMKAF